MYSIPKPIIFPLIVGISILFFCKLFLYFSMHSPVKLYMQSTCGENYLGFQISRQDPGDTVQHGTSGESHFVWLSPSCHSDSDPSTSDYSLPHPWQLPPLSCLLCLLVFLSGQKYRDRSIWPMQTVEVSNASYVVSK